MNILIVFRVIETSFTRGFVMLSSIKVITIKSGIRKLHSLERHKFIQLPTESPAFKRDVLESSLSIYVSIHIPDVTTCGSN